MICKTRNQSNDTTDSQKEKSPILMFTFNTDSQKL